MKKIRIKLLVILGIIPILSMFSCKKSDETELKSEYRLSYTYDTKIAVSEDKDGWIHYFVCEYKKGEDVPSFYMYDAYNLKYKLMEDYVIEVTDKDGNIIENIYPSVPYLMLYNEYTRDFENIDTFFGDVMPIKELRDTEKERLLLDILDKDFVVTLYNEAINGDKLSDGKYNYLPEADIIQEDMKDGYLWQVGFFVAHGVIVSVNIELIYEDESYLSDVISEGVADNNQIEVAQMITEIENYIIENQCFIINDNLYDDSQIVDNTRLNNLLTKIEKGSY